MFDIIYGREGSQLPKENTDLPNGGEMKLEIMEKKFVFFFSLHSSSMAPLPLVHCGAPLRARVEEKNEVNGNGDNTIRDQFE